MISWIRSNKSETIKPAPPSANRTIIRLLITSEGIRAIQKDLVPDSAILNEMRHSIAQMGNRMKKTRGIIPHNGPEQSSSICSIE